jgi:hypothetical protein
MQAAWLSSERYDDAAVAGARLEPNPWIADLGGADQVVERDAIGLREREEQLEARAPLTRLEPRQRALRDPRCRCHVRQRQTTFGTQAFESRADLIEGSSNGRGRLVHRPDAIGLVPRNSNIVCHFQVLSASSIT